MKETKISQAKQGNSVFGLAVLGLSGCLVLLFFLSFMVGTYPMDAHTVWEVLWARLTGVQGSWEPAVEKVIFQVRIPRILLGILVGGGLAVSGASYQTLFKNPMVSPDILGVSAGAGFGAAFAMLHSGSWTQIQLCALVCGLLVYIVKSNSPFLETKFPIFGKGIPRFWKDYRLSACGAVWRMSACCIR